LIQNGDCPCCVFFGGKVDSIVVLETFHLTIGCRTEYVAFAVAEEILLDDIFDGTFEVMLLLLLLPLLLLLAGDPVELLLAKEDSVELILPLALGTAPTPTQ
jgi:hypothetical protein